MDTDKYYVHLTRAKPLFPGTQAVDEYTYANKEDAEKHMDILRNDTSGLYRNIAMIDAKQKLVLRLIVFEDGVFRAEFRDHGIVRLRHGYRETEEEALFLYVITNLHEDMERGLIVCVNSGLPIQPAETICLAAVDPVTDPDNVF